MMRTPYLLLEHEGIGEDLEHSTDQEECLCDNLPPYITDIPTHYTSTSLV